MYTTQHNGHKPGAVLRIWFAVIVHRRPLVYRTTLLCFFLLSPVNGLQWRSNVTSALFQCIDVNKFSIQTPAHIDLCICVQHSDQTPITWSENSLLCICSSSFSGQINVVFVSSLFFMAALVPHCASTCNDSFSIMYRK